jgi:hypothetical protein
MESQYWIQREGKTTGPFSDEQLAQMATVGMILAADMISTDEINWRVAGEVKGLFQTVSPQTASGTSSLGASVSTGGDRAAPGSVPYVLPKKKPGMQPTRYGAHPAPDATAGNSRATAGRPQSQPASPAGDSDGRWPLPLRFLVWFVTFVGAIVATGLCRPAPGRDTTVTLGWSLLPFFVFSLMWGKTKIGKT